MGEEFDYLNQGSMVVVKYEAYFYALFRYSYASFFIEFQKIQKFVKGLDVFLQLDTS